MTPRQFREMAGLTEAYIAAGLPMRLKGFRRLESMPLEVWTVGQLQQHLAACGFAVRIIAVDGHGVERPVT